MDKPEPIRFSFRRLLVTTLIAGLVWIVISGDIAAIPNLARLLVFNTRAHFSYNTALSAGDYKKARSMFESDIKANPADPQVYETIAAACEGAKQYDMMREYLERALLPCRDAPRDERSRLYFTLSECYVHIEKSKPQLQAILAAQRAMELDPLSPEKLNAYGYLLADNGLRLEEALLRTGQALQLLKKEPQLASINPDFPAQVEDSYGWALYKLGRYDDAVSALNQAISDYPDKETAQPKTPDSEALSTMYFHVGAAYRRQRRPDAASDALQTALRYAPDNNEAKDELAEMKSLPAVAPSTASPPQIGPGAPSAAPQAVPQRKSAPKAPDTAPSRTHQGATSGFTAAAVMPYKHYGPASATSGPPAQVRLL